MSMTIFSLLMGLLAMFGLGISNATAKPVAKQYGPAMGVLWRNTIMAILLGVTLIASWNFTAIDQPNYWFILASVALGVGFYVALFLFYKSIAVGKIGVVAPIANSNVLITAVLSAVLLQQFIEPKQWLAIGCIVIGVIVFSFDIMDWTESPIFSRESGVRYALVVMLMWGVLFALYVIPAAKLGPIVNAFVLELTIACCALVHLLKKQIRSFRLSRDVVKYTIACGVFGAVSSIAVNFGMVYGSVAIVIALMGANPLVSAIYGWIVYGEKLMPRELYAVSLTIIGIVLIAL